MRQFHTAVVSAFCVGIAIFLPVAHAQSTVTSSNTATLTQAGSKLTNQFTAFAGSQENANALISGLRTGKAITLTPSASTSGGAATSSASTFIPPTKPMGYGNIKIALSLAQNRLASQGITNPTPEQIQGALMGTPASGGKAATEGVLQMRASGMGWGKIANTMGVKLGTVMSGKQPAPASTSASTSRTTSRVTSASGSSSPNTASAAKGKGIVNASGGVSHGNAAARGQGPHVSSGIVSATGAKGNAAASHGKSGKQ